MRVVYDRAGRPLAIVDPDIIWQPEAVVTTYRKPDGRRRIVVEVVDRAVAAIPSVDRGNVIARRR
jgi:hypothetical protein